MNEPDTTGTDCPAHEGNGSSDSDVVAASLADPDMFATLYDRYAADIHRFAARRLGLQAADDITADTFLAAFRTRSRFENGRSARPWLYGIAANLIGKRRRSEVRALRALARTGHDPVAESWTGQVEDRVAAQAGRRQLADILAGLKPGDRHVLLLVAWADLSPSEIAQALGIPVGTVRSRLHRVRRQFRAAIADPRAPHRPVPDTSTTMISRRTDDHG